MEEETPEGTLWGCCKRQNKRNCKAPDSVAGKYEILYDTYREIQRRRAQIRLLIGTGLLIAYYLLLPPNAEWTGNIINLAFFSFFVACIAFLYRTCTTRSGNCIVTHLVIIFAWLPPLTSQYLLLNDTYNEFLGWAIIVQFLTIATLPLQVWQMVTYSVVTIVLYVVAQVIKCSLQRQAFPDDFIFQQAANVMYLTFASVMGGVASAGSDRQQRSSFQQTKKSLEIKLFIDEQSKEQERLLLSVLPEHVAVQMRQELGLIDTQFKKIYMSRHENVSILYADIVGFTAISSTYSAQDLVAILNELFARFDRLAEKYEQLRIKILGDCYYCISGAPVERSDHAVLCVHMGLSMVKAIKYVQQTTNSPVDMRVGIHTGAVLAGVLGQRQWQFDVYSRDVELANKMESSGMAGRVHISEATLSFLNDEFEVEPAHGERREEMLRQAGIKTYFIVKVLKPFQGSKVTGNGTNGEEEENFADTPSDLKDDDEESVLSPQDENCKDDKEIRLLHMLEDELVTRDDDKELEGQTSLCLSFTSKEFETGYASRSLSMPLTFMVPAVIMPLSFMGVGKMFMAPPSDFRDYALLGMMVAAALVNITYLILHRYARYKRREQNPYHRTVCAVINICLIVASHILPLVVCVGQEKIYMDARIRALGEDNGIEKVKYLPRFGCRHDSYYYHAGAVALFSTFWITPLSLLSHMVLLFLIAASHVIPLAMYPDVAYAAMNRTIYLVDHEGFNAVPFLHVTYKLRPILQLFIVAMVIMMFVRHLESLSRARYSRAMRVRAQSEQAEDMRRRNQALVYNVLPPHVATHFMGARHHHRDLYSQSYAEVGVLFASMPNFSEFYSEETVNNQGLECLRFLNEVISDFDLLLETQPFAQNIIKIKTIGSTYMAASGLDPNRKSQPSDGITTRWAHLARLVEFALELERVLAGINEQSFNHFVLRMGVNHGPITAGVIGARKPHYDIWGNTVNVASRMESTGKAGCIQVTEETCQILQQFGYFFEQRGLVSVKGKGQLMTYYLQGKRDSCQPLQKIAANEGAGEAVIIANGLGFSSPNPIITIDEPQSDPLTSSQDEDVEKRLLDNVN